MSWASYQSHGTLKSKAKALVGEDRGQDKEVEEIREPISVEEYMNETSIK